MSDMPSQEEFDRAVAAMRAAAEKGAAAMLRLQSAFVVFGMEVRELIEAKYPKNFAEPTAAAEIAEAAMARAQKPHPAGSDRA